MNDQDKIWDGASAPVATEDGNSAVLSGRGEPRLGPPRPENNSEIRKVLLLVDGRGNARWTYQ